MTHMNMMMKKTHITTTTIQLEIIGEGGHCYCDTVRQSWRNNRRANDVL